MAMIYARRTIAIPKTMHRIFITLTVLSIFAHAVLGCCAHAVPFTAAGEVASECGEHATHETSHSHHHGEDSSSPCNHGPDEGHACHHAKCQWLSTSTGVQLSIASPFECSYLTSEQLFPQEFAISSLRLAALSGSPPTLPLRSHLALSILLV